MRIDGKWKLPKSWGEKSLHDRPDLKPSDVKLCAKYFVDYHVRNSTEFTSEDTCEIAWRGLVGRWKGATSAPPMRRAYTPPRCVQCDRIGIWNHGDGDWFCTIHDDITRRPVTLCTHGFPSGIDFEQTVDQLSRTT